MGNCFDPVNIRYSQLPPGPERRWEIVNNNTAFTLHCLQEELASVLFTDVKNNPDCNAKIDAIGWITHITVNIDDTATDFIKNTGKLTYWNIPVFESRCSDTPKHSYFQ